MNGRGGSYEITRKRRKAKQREGRAREKEDEGQDTQESVSSSTRGKRAKWRRTGCGMQRNRTAKTREKEGLD